jgi:hypothetical protein
MSRGIILMTYATVMEGIGNDLGVVTPSLNVGKARNLMLSDKEPNGSVFCLLGMIFSSILF